MAVCRAGAALDALEASNAHVDAEIYSKALCEWKQEIAALTGIREAVLTTLSSTS
jgi:hypothetical protein